MNTIRFMIGFLFIGWLAREAVVGRPVVPPNSANQLEVYLWTMDLRGNALLRALWPAEITLGLRFKRVRRQGFRLMTVKLGLMTTLAAAAALGLIEQAITAPVLVFLPLVVVATVAAFAQQTAVRATPSFAADIV